MRIEIFKPIMQLEIPIHLIILNADIQIYLAARREKSKELATAPEYVGHDCSLEI